MRKWMSIIEEGLSPKSQDPNRRLLSYMLNGGLSDDLMLAKNTILPEKTWLIHFSANSKQISSQGFQKGTPDLKDMGYAHAGSSSAQGYNYAFAADDEYSIMTLIQYATFGGNLDQAVMFQSSGVYCKHKRDNFHQVIFWGGGT